MRTLDTGAPRDANAGAHLEGAMISKSANTASRLDGANAPRARFLLSACALAIVLLACAVSPTGRRQLLIVPESQLNEMGIAAFNDMKASATVSSNQRVARYVGCVARAILDELGDSGGEWEVEVFEDETPNAFALPGRKIGVHTGLLEVATNQDRLAAVIGHEVGHVLAKHSNERVSQESLAQLGASSAGAVFGPGWGQAFGLGAQYGLLLPYSRAHESEADIIGLDLMSRAGFDPRESVELWRAMSQLGGAKPPEFVSTHPSDETRVENLSAGMPGAMEKYEAARAAGKNPQCRS